VPEVAWPAGIDLDPLRDEQDLWWLEALVTVN
jgi:hypothetical protein